MESRIPLPTDNVFKFYALFGLLLFVFGIGAAIYTTKASNDFLTSAVVELEVLKDAASPSSGQKARREVLERLMVVAKSDREVFRWGISVLIVGGLVMMLVGFRAWHLKIQPIQDEMVLLQLRKLKAELAQLERSARPQLSRRRP